MPSEEVAMSSGIDWSTAVAIEERDGRLWAPVVPQLAQQLGVGAGDVLCYTAFDNGTVEVWSVRRNPYQTLELPADRA
jgi:hypothetical protein